MKNTVSKAVYTEVHFQEIATAFSTVLSVQSTFIDRQKSLQNTVGTPIRGFRTRLEQQFWRKSGWKHGLAARLAARGEGRPASLLAKDISIGSLPHSFLTFLFLEKK